MSDPLPAISESEATGLIAQIYADIRSVNRVRRQPDLASPCDHPWRVAMGVDDDLLPSR
jgi:hypothetical protein